MPNVTVSFNTERHRRLLHAFNERFELAEREHSKQITRLDDSEERFLAYMPEHSIDAELRSVREGGRPEYTTIVIPYSYAVAMTAHTYMTSVFLARSPVFQFSARHGEPEMSVQALEAIIDYQRLQGQMSVPLTIWLLDPFKYGYGIVGLDWETDVVRVSELEEREEMFLGVIPTGKKRRVKVTRTIPGYAGNKLRNVNPRHFLSDPRQPLNRFQEGEFCCTVADLPWHTMVKRAEQGEYFNLDVVKRMAKRSQERSAFDIGGEGSPAQDYPQNADTETVEIPGVSNIPLRIMYVELIPRDWGLGSSTYPEKWVITVAHQKVICGLRPYGALHNKFPFAILETEPDAYAQFKRGMIEVLEPLQFTLDWLINAHFYNVRKALNDQFLVDPTLVYMSDLKNPLPGRYIRLRPKAYAKGLMQQAIQQLPVTDVTRAHLQDSEMVTQMMQRAVGVTDNIMGLVNPGGRKTATEVRTSTSFGINRLKTIGEYYSAMGWEPLSAMMVQNTQQLMSDEIKLKVAGDLVYDTQPFVNVTPELITGFYDFVPVDGTLPVDRFAQASLWRALMAEMRNFPQLMAQYDVGKIFSWVAQLSGLKNINQFRVQVVPDAQAQLGAAAGNLVPLRGAPPSAGAPGPGPSNDIPQPDQLPGLGQTL